MALLRKIGMRGGCGASTILRGMDRFWLPARNPSTSIKWAHTSRAAKSPLELLVSHWKKLHPVKWGAPTLALGGMIGVTYYNSLSDEEENGITKLDDPAGILTSMPTFSLEEIAAHKSLETGIWVTHGDHVYDITEFVENHPGGSKIMLAAGGSIEPFWNIYTIHQTPEVKAMLDAMCIGQIDKDSMEEMKRRVEKEMKNDPYRDDPTRHPAFIVNTVKPFDAETPPEMLTDHFHTPNGLFMVRNHLPVPQLKSEDYALEINVPGRKEAVKLTLEDLKTKFKHHTISATIQCAGNRRDGMQGHQKIYGAMSGFTAISNAQWTGVKVCDVLRYAGVDDTSDLVKHVEFQGWDIDISGEPYGASIPAGKAVDPRGDVLLAFEMNGQELPKDHGYPVRVVAAGFVGARNVKWLRKITVSDRESDLFWQKNDYKSSPPSAKWEEFRFDDAPAIYESPVQSAICYPPKGTKISGDEGSITVKGYAHSGGGKGILRVDVSVDGGHTWQTADLEQTEQEFDRAWAWTLWETEMEIPKDLEVKGGSLEIMCKAVDTAHNVQPESISGIWNLKGFLNNAWHKVGVHITPGEEGEAEGEGQTHSESRAAA